MIINRLQHSEDKSHTDTHTGCVSTCWCKARGPCSKLGGQQKEKQEVKIDSKRGKGRENHLHTHRLKPNHYSKMQPGQKSMWKSRNGIKWWGDPMPEASTNKSNTIDYTCLGCGAEFICGGGGGGKHKRRGLSRGIGSLVQFGQINVSRLHITIHMATRIWFLWHHWSLPVWAQGKGRGVGQTWVLL